MPRPTRSATAVAVILVTVLALAFGSSAHPAAAAGAATKTMTVYITDAGLGDPNPSASNWGQVTSDPPGIDCPADCTEQFASGGRVVLTLRRTDGYAFDGWRIFGNEGGAPPDCGTSETCSLTLAEDTADVSVEAPLRPEVQLWAIPEGAGSLTIDPVESGRDDPTCAVEVPVFAPLPTPCSPRYPKGTPVTVTAVPDPNVAGARFVRWSDFRCSNLRPTCTLTLGSDTTLSAFFSPVYLSVWAGSFGDITLRPPDLTCSLPATTDPQPGDTPCQQAYPLGSTVTLERDPSAALNQSDRWTGSCLGAQLTCKLTMRKNELVRAGTDPAFDIPTPLGPPLRLTRAGPLGGAITVTSTSGPGRMFVCRIRTCTTSVFTRYQRVVLRATGSRRARFTGWVDIRYPFARRPLEIGDRTAVKARFRSR